MYWIWVSREYVDCTMMVSNENPPEIFRNNHPLLDPLCITDRLLVGLVNASLNPPHDRHIRSLKNFLNCSCSAPLFLNPIPGCAAQLLCWLHSLSVNLEIFRLKKKIKNVIASHLHRKGQETGYKFLFIPEEQNLLE